MKDKLLDYCKKYIDDQSIGSSECIYQNDNVILSAYEFIEGICEIVGYHEYSEDEL